MKAGQGVSRKLRVVVLLALVIAGPAALAADPASEPTWIDALQQWFVSLLEEESSGTVTTQGVLHLPGG